MRDVAQCLKRTSGSEPRPARSISRLILASGRRVAGPQRRAGVRAPPATSFSRAAGTWRCARTYRAYVEKAGKLVTLKQKIAAYPKVEKLIGAPNFEIQVVANRVLAPQYQSFSRPAYDGSQ